MLSYRSGWLDQKSLPRDLIKGAVMVSGLSSIPDAEDMPDEALRDEANVLEDIENPPPENIIAVGALEAEGGRDGRRLEISEQLARTLRAEGVEADLLVPQGHDHATLVLSLGQNDSELFGAVLGMIRD